MNEPSFLGTKTHGGDIHFQSMFIINHSRRGENRPFPRVYFHAFNADGLWAQISHLTMLTMCVEEVQVGKFKIPPPPALPPRMLFGDVKRRRGKA